MAEKNPIRQALGRLLTAAALAAALLVWPVEPAPAQYRPSPRPGPAAAPNTASPAPQGVYRMAQEDRLQLGRDLVNMLLQSGESPQPPQHQIPLTRSNSAPEIELSSRDGLVSIIVRNASLREVLTALAQSQRLNIICADNVDANLSITLQNVPLNDALTSIVAAAGATWRNHNGIIHVTNLSNAAAISPDIQGLQIQAFQLDFVAAEDLEPAITNMLSPIGKSNAMRSAAGDNRRTMDMIIVEDLPPYLARIKRYISQVDQPPRQVLIEVQVLEVELEKDDRCGVDFDHVMHFAGKSITFESAGMATPVPGQAFSIELDGGNMNALIEALRTTTDAKTLASPRVLVVNGQEARIQVGEQLGFRVTTTTETSTLESVDFLNVGVVLTVTPRISRDNSVLLSVRPEVSSGQVSTETGLPEEETTEIQTDVLLRDGQAMLIGGLIQESDSDTQTKVAWLGDLLWIGKIFQKNVATKKRSEIIIALTPRVVPYHCDYQQRVDFEIERAYTPLLQGALERFPRPWEPRFPHPIENPTMWRLPPIQPWLLHGMIGRGCRDCEEYSNPETGGGNMAPRNVIPEELPRGSDRPPLPPQQDARTGPARWPSLTAPVVVEDRPAPQRPVQDARAAPPADTRGHAPSRTYLR